MCNHLCIFSIHISSLIIYFYSLNLLNKQTKHFLLSDHYLSQDIARIAHVLSKTVKSNIPCTESWPEKHFDINAVLCVVEDFMRQNNKNSESTQSKTQRFSKPVQPQLPGLFCCGYSLVLISHTTLIVWGEENVLRNWSPVSFAVSHLFLSATHSRVSAHFLFSLTDEFCSIRFVVIYDQRMKNHSDLTDLTKDFSCNVSGTPQGHLFRSVTKKHLDTRIKWLNQRSKYKITVNYSCDQWTNEWQLFCIFCHHSARTDLRSLNQFEVLECTHFTLWRLQL